VVGVPDLPVLIVDDEPQVRSLIRTVLTKHGFRVLEARDGSSALSTVLDLDGAIGLLVTDYSMPGIDGLNLARLLRTQYPAVPILLVSSEAFEGDSLPGDAFLAKPFMPAVLVETARTLHKAQPQQENEQCA
jgi:DNA-binding response OmpR family regulator